MDASPSVGDITALVPHMKGAVSPVAHLASATCSAHLDWSIVYLLIDQQIRASFVGSAQCVLVDG